MHFSHVIRAIIINENYQSIFGSFAEYSKHLNRRDTHINQHSRQKMIQIKRETHVLINTAQKTVHNNLQHALNNRDTPNLATCLFYKDLEKNTTFLT